MNQISGRAIFLLLLFVILIGGAVKIFATTSDTFSGYAWSSNIGWISMNNCQDGVCGSQAYGVTAVMSGAGTMSGYAWSSNIGWITFGDVGCPAAVSGCTGGASLDWAHPNSDTTINMKGWARACSVYQSGCSGALVDNSRRGDWDGYIALNGATWGGKLNPTAGTVTGYAWGSEVVGWVNLSDIKVVAVPPPPAPILTAATETSCVDRANPHAAFSWSVSDPTYNSCVIIKKSPSGTIGTTVDPICSMVDDGEPNPRSYHGYSWLSSANAHYSDGLYINCGDESISERSTLELGNANSPQWASFGKSNRLDFLSSVLYAIGGQYFYQTTLPAIDADTDSYIVRCYASGELGLQNTNSTSPNYTAAAIKYIESAPMNLSLCPAPAADFTITATPSSQKLVDGIGSNTGKKIATFTVSVNPTGSFGSSGDSVALAVQSYPTMPTSTTFNFSSPTLNWNGSSFGTATLTVTINANEVTTAIYTPIVISGTSTPGVRTTNVTVGGKGKKQTTFEEI